MSKLSERQKAFADYYIESLNAEQSAIRAGYSEKYARGNAHKLVANSGIKAYIDERMGQKESARIASQDEVLEHLTKVMRGEEIEEVVGFTDAGAIKVDKIPSIKDRVKAAELLGKRYALFTEKHSVSSVQQVVIVDDLDE